MATRPPPSGVPQGDAQIPKGTILFGVYEVLGVLGGGGMGWVYRARHTQLSSLRAIKVIRPDLTANANMEQLFVREARALMQINHDAIVHCHDLLSEDGRVYLVMELVEGPSLEEVLRDGPIGTEEVRSLMRRIGAGLAAAHALGVVHRDISPGNIILPNGRAEEAKLIDFGVAAVAAVPGQTMVGDFKGKLAYASPEQFGLYGGKVDARSDLYSFGLVLAEAASGGAIPMGQTFYEAVELRKVQPRVPPNVPAELRAEIEPLLRPDPKDRPQSADQMVSAAPGGSGAARVIDTGHARQDAPAQQKPGTLHWIIPLLYSGTAVGVGLGLGFMTWIYRTAGSPPPTAVPTPTTIPVVSPKPIAPSPSGPTTPTSITPPKVQVRPPAPITPAAPPIAPAAPPINAANGSLTRAQVMQTADELSRYTWVCKEANRHAACVRSATYVSDWQPNQQVAGLPYHWGGADGPQEFERKLRVGLGAGSHQRNGVNQCTAGIDCSGFVAYCWGHQTGKHDFSTATLDGLATRLNANVYRDLKPGDALNKPGSHVVLFAGYRPDGGPIVYEASGAAGRVIRNDRVSWSRLAGYVPVRSNRLVDP
ncbi:putative Mitogen-activated protein kinase kinase [Candidatus Sulfopaludibacter sp. SbA6]|nr:putative Mitogen-activated protein kinase kinase [Candidatus Sulfopaludibacter sp. SbA6]